MSDSFEVRIDINDEAIDPNATPFWVTVGAITLFLAWGTFVVLFFSRVSALFFTFVLDKYLRLSKNGIHFRIGGISISGLHAGKIMFRNVIYDNGDMTLKVNDGHLLFKFWRPVEHRHLDLTTKRASRLHLSLNGLHLNIYNNLTKYAEIARIRRFDWFYENTNMTDAKRLPTKPPDTSPPSSVWENMWNLLGIVNIEVSAGCILAGNKFLPYALWTRFENMISKTSVTESANDRALLTFEGEMENLAVSLVKNEQFQFTSKEKEPPRTMGNDGCPLLQSASLEFNYKQDLLGYVTDDEPQSITVKVPVWSSEWRLGSNTVLSYGPWAEQQRFLIYSFFYPPDYQNVSATVMPTRGQKRIHVKHNAKIVLTKETCMDIWFMRGDQLESIRTRCGPQSNIDISILWITTEKGFYWNMKTELLSFETTTSLVFTKLIECQKFCVDGSFVYPLTWNGEQTWTLDYTFTNAAAWFVWDHKRLFTDLVNDWIGDDPSDISKFVPFRVHNRMKVVEGFEVIMLLNESNWVDTADKNAENVEVAIVGEKLTFDCELPFIDFLPQTQLMKYALRGEKGVAMRSKFPPDSATAPMRAALGRLARCNPYASPSKYGTHSLDRDTWFELWRTELVKMDFDHHYRPLVIKSNIPSDIPFSVLSDYLPAPANHPWELEPDFLGVNILIEGSDVKFTGLLVKLLFEMKNNYFGWYDSMTSLDDVTTNMDDPIKLKATFDKTNSNGVKPIEWFRSMNVDVTVRVCNIRAEMLLYSPSIDEGSGAEPEKVPVIFVEEVAVEVKKTKTQALIQVGVSPACAYLDKSSAGSSPGCITLSGFQFRGHAMYSEKEVSWNMGLVEYGWIMEILVGDIGGTLDFPTHALVLHQIVETLLLFVLSPDDATKVPDRMQFCQHGQLTKACSVAGSKKNEATAPCRTEEAMKYRQVRISVDSVDLTFVEEKTILQIDADPVRVTVCNAHEGKFTEHVCIRVPGICIRQAVRIKEKPEKLWIEGANAAIEGVSLDIELPNPKSESPNHGRDRLEFVKRHDKDTKRLHFLWADHSVWGCACFGNTCFFGDFDAIGSSFMETQQKRKFFIPGIEKNSNLQPKVLQSIILSGKNILSGQAHQFYKKPKQKDVAITIRKESSVDTESFHSAKSQQAPGRRLLQSAEMTSSYAEFVDGVAVEMPSTITVPQFGEPGAILEWCQEHPPVAIIHDANNRGVNEVRFQLKSKKTNNVFSVVDKKDDLIEQDLADHAKEQGRKRRLAISGVAATSFDLFVTPIGVEAIERLITTATHSISAINPCLLVHMCYRDCVLRKHRQPLTESLFADETTDSDLLPEINITVDLPRVTLGLFQCGVKKNVPKSNNNEHITANLALFLIDRAYIQSKLMHENSAEQHTLAPENSIPSSTLYQVSGSAITVQLLQLTNRDAPDFGSSGMTTTTPNSWNQCSISRRMSHLEPRVMLDFNISDTSIILERRPILVFLSAKSNVSMTPINSPANAPTPTSKNTTLGAATPSGDSVPLKKKQKLLCEHYLKAAIGSVSTSLVMARPQELTAGDEFPIYEALAPVMVSWLSVVDNFGRALDKMMFTIECWKSVAMAKVLKLALDCTDDKVVVKVGKNRMGRTRLLSKHQSSCPSCILLKTLFRWFAYAENAPKSVGHRLDIRQEFEVEETRKTALMALLSHWQADVGKELKLVSYEDANKFKVTRPDEVAIVALTKSKRSRKKNVEKNETVKKETRVMIEPTKSDQPKGKRGRMSPAPLLRKLRMKGGEEDVYDEDSIKQLGDMEMHEEETEHGVSWQDDYQDFDDDDFEPKKEEKVDLYTWMRNAQRESTLRRRKLAGAENVVPEELNLKGYINPMDIQQKAYYYNIYRWAQLQWTTLDSVENDHWHLDYQLILREVDVRMMAKSIKSSTDHSRQFITPAQQKVMQLRNASLNGEMIWKMERDERRKIPLYGQWNINYSGNVEGIRFLIGMATVSLGKELSLVMRVAMEAKNELKLITDVDETPRVEIKRFSKQNNQIAEWDEKVLDMTRDYEKHMQRMRSSKEDCVEKVKVMVNGSTVVSSVVLESVLNDLYVSVTISQIDLSHAKKPLPDVPIVQQSVTVTTNLDEKKTATLTKKSNAAVYKVDDLSISLTKMKLTLSEADSANKKTDILRCTLNTSSFCVYTNLDSPKEANRSTSTIAARGIHSLSTTASLRLGALEGNMPMAAYSLHDVVMRHGKELEQQLNRLAAQPATTPLSNPKPFPNEPLLARVSDAPSGSSTPTLMEPPVPVQASTPVNVVAASPGAGMYSGSSTANTPLVRRVPVAVVAFTIELTSIEMNIQLLPSLQAKYRINLATSSGITGVQANWTILLGEHFFEFCVTGQGGKTETFRLQLPSVKCVGLFQTEQGTAPHKPSTDKKLIYREGGSLQMTVTLGTVNHVFTTELLNQLMFAEHSFRTELTALINRIRSSSFASATNSARSPMGSQSSNDRMSSSLNLKLLLPVQHPPTTSTQNEKPPLLFSIKILTKDTTKGDRDENEKKELKEVKPVKNKVIGASSAPNSETHHHAADKAIPWLQLTAATPTQTAVRLTIDSLEGELTNKWVVKEEGCKERIYGNAVIHFNAKLGQLIKQIQNSDSSTDMQEFATFMTQVRVENKDRSLFNSSYSYHISLNRPILLVKAAAIDKAILLWLNYKNTYDFWRNEREKVVQEKTTKKASTASTGMFSPTQIAEDADMNLSLAINNGMYLCMPLYSHDVTEGMPALVLSLQKSELSVLVKKELTCKASFNGFKCSFIDDFDEQALTQSFLDAAHSDQSNCFFFPEGTYQLCSKAESSGTGPAKWVLNVSAEMQGVEIDLDTRIGKLAKLLVNTFSMIGKDDDDDMSIWDDQGELDSDEEKVEGAAELKKLKAEEKVPWMENKMHEHSRAVFELAARGVSTKKIEAEKHKLRQYELIRFKAFRRNVVENLKRGTNSNRAQTEAPLPQKSPSRRNSNTRRASSAGAVVQSVTQESGTAENEKVNFNMDVKVNITSGTCTVRTGKKEGTMQLALPGIRDTFKRLNLGTKIFDPQVVTTTTFSIPSVEIKAYHVSDPSSRTVDEMYNINKERREKISKVLAQDADKLYRDLNVKSRFSNSSSSKKAKETPLPKRGCFYIFMGLASMPTETVVTPHLATYLEQVLEPLPPSAVFHSQTHTQDASTVDDIKNDGTHEVHNIVAMDTAAFPIDFVFYLDVQSSTIRFDGKQPTSRSQAQADCLLTLPRLTLEVTSKRTRDNIDNYVGGIHISGQFKGFMLKIFNPLEPELDSLRALQLSLDLLSFVISRNKNSSTEPDNRVRFVFSSQISKASFDYNFRRLGELIQFPKPWYRAAIARRVFFGDQAAPRQRDDVSEATGTTRSRLPTDPKFLQPALSTVSTGSSGVVSHQRKPWTALVLAAVQWNEFEVTAFMSNTMGKTTWKATRGLLWGDAKLNSLNEKDISTTFVLGSSELCARDGAISGVIKLHNLKVSGDHSLAADVKKPPVNKAKMRLDWITANIEWMSRRVLVAKWSNPQFRVNDYYKGVKENDQMALTELGMNVQAAWKDLQVVITKSTVDDVAAIVHRLISFIDEQLKNSRILLGNFTATSNIKKTASVHVETRKPTTHFWEKVLDYMSEMQMNEQLMGLMEKEGAKVGGHMELKAGGISLVLMKGDMNVDTWAVFHLRDACISFDPEARMDFLDHTSKQKIGILLKHVFSLKLGAREGNQIENRANVCRVQTRFNNSRHLQRTEDILEFFIGDVMKMIGSGQKSEKTRNLKAEPSTTTASENSPQTSFTRFRSPVSSQDPETTSIRNTNHSVMELFQFPGLEARMTSEQLNGVDDGDKYESVFQMPMEVMATFICDFFSEVAIETNFNAQVSFLPELLKSYLKETNTHSSHSSASPAPTSSKESVLPDGPKDPRIFTCKEWKVEPKVRFIDRIKWTPPVVDEILKKLQIFDHRNTIPKVIQRAVLDPLDATLAASVIATLQIVDNKKTIAKFKKSRADSVSQTPKNRDDQGSNDEVSVNIDIPDIITKISRESSKLN